MNRKNSRHGGKEKRDSRSVRLEMEALNMLTPVVPDMFAWESGSSGYSHDYLSTIISDYLVKATC